jgi:hypothetical protein
MQKIERREERVKNDPFAGEKTIFRDLKRTRFIAGR